MIPVQITIYGVFVPTVLLVAAAALVLFFALDRGLHALGVYRWVWHPALCRLALLAGLFCALYLLLY